MHLAGKRLGQRQRLQIFSVNRGASLHAREKVPQRSGELLACSDGFGFLVIGEPVEQRAAHRAVLDVGAFVHAEKSQRLLVGDPVAIDQPFDLGARNRRELGFISVERTEPRCIGATRKPPERLDQRLGLRV